MLTLSQSHVVFSNVYYYIETEDSSVEFSTADLIQTCHMTLHS